MLTPKEALEKDGKIVVKSGRGRMSREAVMRCKELAALGWNIKGYTVVKAKPVKEKTPKAVASVPRTPGNQKVIADYVIFYEESEFKAMNGKTEYSMRECCNACMVSLVQCHCGSPTIRGDIAISIVPRP